MKSRALVAALCLGLAALSTQARETASTLVYIGTRGSPTVAPTSQGVYAARLDTKTGKLTGLGLQSQLVTVSWVTAHPSKPLLFVAANPDFTKTAITNIYSYAIDTATGQLRPINQVAPGPQDTTHISIDTKSNTLFGAAFGTGEVSALPILADGSLGQLASSLKHEGSGPHPRQNVPHAHAVAIDSSGRYVLSSDMGADRVFVHRFDPASRALTPATPPAAVLPPGTGPRHLVLHPSGKFVYTNTEITADVFAYRWHAKQGVLEFIESQSAYPAGYTANDKSSSEIGVSPDGRFLYVALRGNQDSIVVYAVNQRSGALKEVQRIASQGKSPRSFGFDPSGRWLLVTHDTSGTVNVFGVDKKTGKLNPTGESLALTGAATVAFY